VPLTSLRGDLDATENALHLAVPFLVRPLWAVCSAIRKNTPEDTDATTAAKTVSEAGWGSANKHVLHKMLESESETSSPANRAKSRLTTDNYYFNMVGTEGIEVNRGR